MQINGMPAILSPCELKFIIIWDVALARLKMQTNGLSAIISLCEL